MRCLELLFTFSATICLCSQPLPIKDGISSLLSVQFFQFFPADNFGLLFKKNMRITFLNPIKKTVLILYKEILEVSVYNNCLGKNF